MSHWIHIRLVLDRLVAIAVWPAVAPVVLWFEWLVRRSDGGPGVISLPRVGRDGRVFRMYKLRSMRIDNGDGTACGPPMAGTVDTRVTPLGRRLRRFHLDELPQFLNVMRGEMSLIGPRPEAPEFVDDADEAWQDVLRMPPGVAGPTQVALRKWEKVTLGRDPTADRYREEVLPLKVRVDRWYVREATPATDGLVLAALVARIIRRNGRRWQARLIERAVPGTWRRVEDDLRRDRDAVS